MLLQHLTNEINNKIYFQQEPKKFASALALLKISYKVQLKSLKHLPPQSLAYEVYLKQENEAKGFETLLPQSHHTRKINDTMQQTVVTSFPAVTSAPNQR